MPALAQRLVLQRLGLQPVLSACAVLLPSDSYGCTEQQLAAGQQPLAPANQQQQQQQAAQQRRVLLCALHSGQLQMASMPDTNATAGVAQPQPHQRTLLREVTVRTLLHHPTTSKLLAIGHSQQEPVSPPGSADSGPGTAKPRFALYCVDAASGECCSWSFDACEQPQSMCVWDADGTALQTGFKLEPAAASSSRATAAPGFAATLVHRLHSSMRMPPASSARQRPLSHPCGVFAGPHVGVGELVVVGTCRADGRTGAAPECLGQLLVLQLLAAPLRGSSRSNAEDRGGSQGSSGGSSGGSSASSSMELERWPSDALGRHSWGVRLLARLRMPDPVWAVTACGTSTLLVSVGQRLVLYGLAAGRLQKLAVQPVLGQVTALSCDRASGVMAAVDRRNGLVCYRYLVPKGSSQQQEQTLHVVSAQAAGPMDLLACSALPGGAVAALAADGTFIQLGGAAEASALPCSALQLQASHRLRALAVSMQAGGSGAAAGLYVPTLVGSLLCFRWFEGREGALLRTLHDAAAAAVGSLTAPTGSGGSSTPKALDAGSVADGALLRQLLELPRAAQLQALAHVPSSLFAVQSGSAGATGLSDAEQALLLLQRFLGNG